MDAYSVRVHCGSAPKAGRRDPCSSGSCLRPILPPPPRHPLPLFALHTHLSAATPVAQAVPRARHVSTSPAAPGGRNARGQGGKVGCVKRPAHPTNGHPHPPQYAPTGFGAGMPPSPPRSPMRSSVPRSLLFPPHHAARTRARTAAVALPMPLEPPVMSTVRPRTSKNAARVARRASTTTVPSAPSAIRAAAHGSRDMAAAAAPEVLVVTIVHNTHQPNPGTRPLKSWFFRALHTIAPRARCWPLRPARA